MKRILILICAVLFVLLPLASVRAGDCGYNYCFQEAPVTEASGGGEVEWEGRTIEAPTFKSYEGKVDYEHSPVNKFSRGAINIAGSPAEVLTQFINRSQEKDPLYGATIGVAEGILIGLTRLATGVFEVGTFFVPSYDKPIMKPENPFTLADKKFREYFW